MWLYLPPCSASASAPEPEAWNSACTSPSQDIALFAWSSGTPMLRPLSWPGWLTKPWIRRLSGLMCDPSMAAHGAASWISLLRATRASRSPSRAGGSVRPTPATFGRRLPGLSARHGPAGSSQKTSLGIFLWDSEKSPEALKAWATALQRECSQREKRGRAITGGDSSSWPTPTVAWYKYDNGLTVGAGTFKFEAKTQRSIVGTAASWTLFWELLHSTVGPELIRTLAICPSTRPAQVMLRPGPTCSAATLGSNPRFLEMLMGWPDGWTDSASPVMGFAPWLRRMRGALSRLS